MELIVVPPVYFDVVDSYNTRMQPNHPYGRPDKARAAQQWADILETVTRKMKIDVRIARPLPNLHDMAFACDPGLWVDDLFIASNFWAKPRQPEAEYFKEWFRSRKVEVTELPGDALFEGGDCLIVGNNLLLGWGDNRTNWRGVEEVTKILKPRGIRVVPVQRVTEEFYHLNSVMTYYPSINFIAYYPPAFEKNVLNTLRANLFDVGVVPLADSDAMRNHPDFGGEYLYSYTLNSIEHNGKVIMPYCAPQFGEFLEGLGLEVIVPPDGSSEFERSGGSFRCLTMIHNTT